MRSQCVIYVFAKKTHDHQDIFLWWVFVCVNVWCCQLCLFIYIFILSFSSNLLLFCIHFFSVYVILFCHYIHSRLKLYTKSNHLTSDLLCFKKLVFFFFFLNSFKLLIRGTYLCLTFCFFIDILFFQLFLDIISIVI